MNKVETVLEQVWADTQAPLDNASSSRSFELAVMEKIASRRLLLDFAFRAVLVAALLLTAWALSPALSGLSEALAVSGLSSVLTSGGLVLAAALAIGAGAQRWTGLRLRF
ncbi:MAG: hypothetical protein AAFX09_07855 [Pseudomonadota bacterium]